MRCVSSFVLALAWGVSVWRIGSVYADTFVRGDIITDPAPERFSVCSGYSCREVTQVPLTPVQWQQVRDRFSSPAETAEDERRDIAHGIAFMETLVGPLAGTSNDKGPNFQGVGTDGQMDCIDEFTNTTSYLTMLVQEGLVTRHSAQDRVMRGFFHLRLAAYHGGDT